MLLGINSLAVVASAVINLIVGFVWFNVIFREAYIAGLARTREQMEAGPSAISASIMQFVGFVVLAAGLGWLMQRANMVSLSGGLTIAFVAWLAFVAAIIGPMYAFQAFPLSMFGIVAVGYLISLLIAGAMLGLWR